MNTAKDTVCIYSGGMDSYTLAAWLRSQGRLHSCLSFNYGQRHAKELDYAIHNCELWDIPHRSIDLQALTPFLSASGSALLGGSVPEGHYAEESMKQTVVPNRNMIMLSVAIAYAVAIGLPTVAYGAHSGDHTIYPDCRPEFVDAVNALAAIANWQPVRVEAPFLSLDKGSILSIGHGLGLDYAQSWTCYKGGVTACGVCGSCQERLEAFYRHGWIDPLEYQTRELIQRSGR